MLLDRFLPRIEFDSYEDFKKNYKVNAPEDFNFAYDIVDEWAKQDVNKKALVWCDDHGSEVTLTFEEIRKMSNKAANYFSSLGLKKGSVVLLILRQRWEYWVCVTALMKLGVIFIPATLQLTKKDIVYRANAAGVEMILCINDDYVVDQVEASLPEMPNVKNIGLVNGKRDGWFYFHEAIEPFSDSFTRPEDDQKAGGKDIMQIYFTSGTTGMPKMVCHNYLHPLGHIVTAKYWHMVQEDKLHMTNSDSGWAKFGWGKIYGQWICGAVIFAYDTDKFNAKNMLSVIEKYKITTFCVPPTIYRFMLQEDVKAYDLSSVERWTTAGEPLSAEVVNKWKELTGHTIASGFGQTEGTVLIAEFPWFETRPGSLGKPSPIYNIQLLNSDGEECESGEEGEIVIKDVLTDPPIGLFVGYYHNEEMTEKALGSGIYNLKDVAWKDTEGYFWFVGRHDDVIKCSGYRIGPFEVESALNEHPAVIESAITAAQDPIRGQVVMATVKLADGYSPSPELIKELQNHVKKLTAPYKYPRIVEFVDELPKTVGGKIKRAEITRKYNERMLKG